MSWTPSGRSRRFRFRFPAFTPLFLFPTILVTLIFWWNGDAFFGPQHKKPVYGYAPGISKTGACTKWQGASDVVVVMKTGASEIEAKLPIHLNTTFKCAPNVMVFSDMAQQFEGLRIHDPLRQLAANLDKADPDLMYYMSLMERQRAGQDIMKGNNTQAWALDRYKNIPMLRRAYETYPDAKWFVFMDVDTALIWSNLLTWLSQMDSYEPRYIGSSVVGGIWEKGENIRFAHGGTGYIISHAAAKLIAEETDEEQKKSFEITREDCCGDSALGKVLSQHGVLITPAFPNVNGETLYHIEYDKDSLCFAPVTMHHMNAEEIKVLVKYQEIMSNGGAIRYADLFRRLVRPQLLQRVEGWDNRSSRLIAHAGKKSRIKSYNGCQLRCKKDKKCLQFSFEQGGHCKISRSVVLGKPTSQKIESGWMIDRIDKFVEKEGTCAAQWILS